MAETPGLVSIRSGTDDDVAFIYATWLRSMWTNNPAYSEHMVRAEFFKGQHEVIEGLLSRGAAVSVACPEEYPNLIVGYSVSEPGVLHWVYVKEGWRRWGIAAKLLSAHPWTRYSAWSPDLRFVRHHGAVYNPYLLTKRGHE